jgi:hypothetical protein
MPLIGMKEIIMKDLLNKVRNIQREADPQEVQALIADLGATPSIAVLEEVVKHYKEVVRSILTKDLLEWMQENDMDTFENEDVKVSIATYVSAKVQDPDKAFQWLQSHQYGDLIKDSLDFQKGELSPELEEAIASFGVSYSKKSGIHPQSLKKIISDRLKSGEALPDAEDGIEVNYFDECRVKEK